MQQQITEARSILDGIRAELNMVRIGCGGLLRERPDAQAARLMARLQHADRLLAQAADSGRAAGAEIVAAVRRAGCSPRPAATTCEARPDPTRGYPGPTAGSVVNGQPVRPAAADQVVLSRPSPFFGVFATEYAEQLADAHAAGLGKEHG